MTFRRTAPSAALDSNPLRDDAQVARLHMLEAYEILDSAPEKSYDDIARLAAFICGTPLAVISFIDQDRQWIKACFSSGSFAHAGLDLTRALPWPDMSDAQDDIILMPDMAADAQSASHALIPGGARLRFYAAAPLIAPNGTVLGSLSVLDRRVRNLSADQISALRTLARQVLELLDMRRTVIGLSAANARLGQQNLTDALTAIPNRRAYDLKISEEVSRARRTGAALSLLMIDIDLFKQYNDNFGHPAGDSALQSVARVLQASLRPYDFLARYGGEEFAIILPATALADAMLVAERVRLLVAGSEFPHRKFTVSIGVARLEAESGVKGLLHDADRGLYQAKAGGRNRVMTGNASEVEAV